MLLKEEIQKDNHNKNRLFNIYSCDICSTEYRKQKRISQGALKEHYCSDKCFSLRPNNPYRTSVVCAHCGITFTKANSRLANSRSGLYFCCREHKDIGQKYIKEIQPEHYGTAGPRNYRRKALTHYKHECNNCGYNIFEALEVHHIDKNIDNDSIENLVILCANCHLIIHKSKE